MGKCRVSRTGEIKVETQSGKYQEIRGRFKPLQGFKQLPLNLVQLAISMQLGEQIAVIWILLVFSQLSPCSFVLQKANCTAPLALICPL